jgi:ATP-binding cassette subfamily F protein uup
MDKLTEHLFIFKGNGIIKDEYSSYSEYRLKVNKEQKNDKKADRKNSDSKTNTVGIVKFSYDERKEHKSLEKQINKLELVKKEMESFFKDSNNSYEQMHEKGKELEKLNSLLDDKLNRWMELDELKNNV